MNNHKAQSACKTSRKAILILILGVIGSASAFASGPNFATKCPSISAPDKSSGVYFDDDCTTAYVLPPTTGSATVTKYQQNMNLGFCQALKDDEKTADLTAESRRILAEKLSKMAKDFEPLSKEKDEADLDYSKKQSESAIEKLKMQQLEGRNDSYGQDIKNARTAYQTSLNIDPNSEATKAAEKNLMT
jgi:hypothetical protein